MKILNTLLTVSLIALGTASFASTDGSDKKWSVPVAPSVWESPEIEAPELLKFVKAKNAFVPVAPFVWGDPSDTPANLLMVPLAPFVYGNVEEEVPNELAFIRAKSAFVPVAPFEWGNASDKPEEISEIIIL